MDTSIDWINFGKRIKNRRKSLDLTQDYLAEKLDITATHLSRIESGKQIPSLTLFLSICNHLKTTPDYLILGNTRTNNIPAEIVESLNLLSQKDIDLIRYIVDKMILLAYDSSERL